MAPYRSFQVEDTLKIFSEKLFQKVSETFRVSALKTFPGCVVETDAKLKTVERSFRITSALIQGCFDYGTDRVVIYFQTAEQVKPLQMALLTEDYPYVNFDMTFKAGERVIFFKRGSDETEEKVVVQLMGYYLDRCDDCTGKKASALPTRGKKMAGLPLNEETASFRDSMNTIFVKENMEINIKAKEVVDVQKMLTDVIQLEEELKRKNDMVEKLYSQVKELKVQVQQLQMRGQTMEHNKDPNYAMY